jgi:hypothetical protein
MPLRKSPTLAPALLEACRRNARKFRGPSTRRGKANVRMNASKGLGRSQLLGEFQRNMYRNQVVSQFEFCSGVPTRDRSAAEDSRATTNSGYRAVWNVSPKFKLRQSPQPMHSGPLPKWL